MDGSEMTFNWDEHDACRCGAECIEGQSCACDSGRAAMIAEGKRLKKQLSERDATIAAMGETEARIRADKRGSIAPHLMRIETYDETWNQAVEACAELVRGFRDIPDWRSGHQLTNGRNDRDNIIESEIRKLKREGAKCTECDSDIMSGSHKMSCSAGKTQVESGQDAGSVPDVFPNGD